MVHDFAKPMPGVFFGSGTCNVRGPLFGAREVPLEFQWLLGERKGFQAIHSLLVNVCSKVCVAKIL